MVDTDYKAQFHKYLDDYRLSDAAAKKIAGLKLALLVGPSSSGRNALINELLKTGEYHFIVSDTTRPPRINDGVPEENGVTYWFRSDEEVLRDLKTGHFLEASLNHKSHVYGISVREVNKALQDDKIAITDVEVFGARNIHRAKPDTVILFVIPPSFPVWIERLHHRGVLPEDAVRNRMESALNEYAAALEEDFYTYIINDRLEDAAAKVYEATKFGRVDAADQAHGRSLIEGLLRDTREYLRSAS